MNLENTKVYTIDAGVIRKYAELCGVDHITAGKSLKLGQKATGAAYINGEVVAFGYSFIPSYVDFNELTVGLINDLYEEKFGKTETPEEAEAFDIMAQDNEQLQNHEMNDLQLVIDVDGKLYTADDVRSLLSLQELHAGEWKAGDECEIEMDGKRQPYIFGCLFPHDKLMAIVFTGNSHMTIPSCRLLKPETEDQRNKRERLEAAYDLYCTLNAGHSVVEFDRFKGTCRNWLRVVDKTNYRK